MSSLHIGFLVCVLLCPTIQAARILVYLPLSTWSHYMQYELLYETLAARGHDLTIYSPYPPRQNGSFNHVPVESKVFLKIMDEFDAFRDCKDMNWFFMDAYMNLKFNENISREILGNATFRDLITSKQTFDLVMIEPFFYQESLLVLGHIFKAPVIHMGAVGPTTNILDAMHSPNMPSFMPEVYSFMTDRMTLLQRLHNWYYSAVHYCYRTARSWMLDGVLKDMLGPGIPSVDSMLGNISFAFLYSNLGLEYAKPLAPNMVQVGGIHMQRNETVTIPKDLKKTLDDATDGFILFSLGSVITPKTLPPHLSTAFQQVFSKLKFKIIWKWSGEPLVGLPPNVIQQKWVPQRPVLAHPNCKLFITHGGLSSQLETIHAGVPVVVIPFFGDQFSNAAKAVDFGFGELVKFKNLTSNSLEWAINTVTGDPRYKQKALERSRLSKDFLRSPLDTAVFWTEYVLQHKGAQHLAPASKHLHWIQYHLLDVMAILLVIPVLGVLFLKKLWRSLCGKRKDGKKEKVVKNKRD